MKREGNEPEVPSGEIAKLVAVATQTVGQLRQIKIVVLIYAVSSLLISIGSMVYSAVILSQTAQYADGPGESEPVTADDEAASVGPSEDDPLPPFSLADADGRVWSDRDLDGKAVLLNFWTTWCAPCRKEMPIFDEMQEIYGPKGFTVLAVSLDQEGWDVVRPYMAERKFSYPVFVGDESVERGFGRITSFPTTYFVRRDGTIDTKHVGGLSRSHVVRRIESVLGIESETRTDAADGFSPPKMLDFSAPRLTKELQAADGRVSVDVQARVGVDGSVHDVKVVRGAGVEMDQRVVEAVQRARFEPAKKAGKPVPMQMRWSIRINANTVARPYDLEQ